jgi:hypothetical protein
LGLGELLDRAAEARLARTDRVEALALRAGVDANELRELLYDEIERRRGEGPSGVSNSPS